MVQDNNNSPDEKDSNKPSQKTSQAVADMNSADEISATEAETEPEIESQIESEVEPEDDKEPVTIEFPFSEMIRSKVPKAFEVAEKVATDWKYEGDFTDLGISHPVAGIVASQALQKAKEVEKKLEEKGVISIAKVGIEIAKSQVENIKNKVKKN